MKTRIVAPALKQYLDLALRRGLTAAGEGAERSVVGVLDT